MEICFENLVNIEVLMVGELDSTLICRLVFSHQELCQPSRPGCEALWMFPDSYTSGCEVPRVSYPGSVSPETLEEIMTSKVPVHGDHVQWQPVGVNSCAGVEGVQTLNCLVCELHLPTFSEVERRWKTPPIVWPVGEPTPWEVGSTKLPFSKSPHTTVLPGKRGVVEKAKHGKDINFFSSPKTLQKGAFEHKTHTRGRTCF